MSRQHDNAIIAQMAAAIDPSRHHNVEDERHLRDDNDPYRAAAVLIAITDRAEPGVILTQRPANLRSHPGQVAFPGGKIDDDDADAVAAALREAEEEIGIPPSAVHVIGQTDVYMSGSGYQITPVVGIIAPDLDLRPNPDEVEDWFEVPLGYLLDQTNYTLRHSVWMGSDRRYYDMTWQNRRIWGVTAGIIINLAKRMEQSRMLA